MNVETGLMLGGAISSIAVQGYGCWTRKRKRKKWEKEKLSACIMSEGCGKSTLAKFLKGDSKLMIIDVSDAIPRESSHFSEADYLMKSKEYIDDMKAKLPQYKLLLLVSSVDEAKHYGVKEENICCLTPSTKCFNDIIKGVTAAKAESMQRSRLELISSCERDQLNVFDTFESLYENIRLAYKLKNNF
jgi:adenylate kinase family enzyme